MNVIRIPANELELSSAELALRMQVPRSFDLSAAKNITKELLPLIDCRAAGVCVPVDYRDGALSLGDISTDSRDLKKALGDSREALIFAVTLGMGVERYLLRLSRISVSDHFTADAVLSAYAEAAADKAQQLFCCKSSGKVRFSPGYGDLPLKLQPLILSALGAQKNLGITLTDTLLMKPQKSITAIVGI